MSYEKLDESFLLFSLARDADWFPYRGFIEVWAALIDLRACL
jgi:hypothetical protein